MKLEVYMAMVLCIVLEMGLSVLLEACVHQVFVILFIRTKRRVLCIEVVLLDIVP